MSSFTFMEEIYMGEKTFRERVKDTVIREARNYKTTYIDFEYLLLVNKSKRKFCII